MYIYHFIYDLLIELLSNKYFTTTFVPIGSLSRPFKLKLQW